MHQIKPTPTGLTIRQAAALVGVREYEIREGIAAGRIPHMTHILVEPTDIHDWAQTRECKAVR